MVEPSFGGAAGFGVRPEQRINMLVPNDPPVRSSILFGVIAASLFIGGFSAWTVFAPLSRAAVGDGVLQSFNQRRVIQHLEGGIISNSRPRGQFGEEGRCADASGQDAVSG